MITLITFVVIVYSQTLSKMSIITKHGEETHTFIVARYPNGTRPNCISGPPNIDRASRARCTTRSKRVKEINAKGQRTRGREPPARIREKGDKRKRETAGASRRSQVEQRRIGRREQVKRGKANRKRRRTTRRNCS